MQTILGMIDEFVEKELIPLEPEFLTKPSTNLIPVFEEKRKMVKQMELWAPNHPREYGGMELDLLEHALVSESLGRSPLGHYIFGCQAPDAGNIEILHQFGSDEQKAKYLGPLVDGKIRSCFSMTEVELPGSNPVMMDTTAVKDGCHQRSEMVYFIRRRGRICDCYGRHQSRGRTLPASEYDYCTHGHPRF
jgi:alkylation response protein AidB-like acyl-CoA dehydrogenase